jgi:UDP-N-acetylmuramate dehydrogenase
MSIKPAVLHDEPMAKHTSWRVGGPADRFARPASVAELKTFLAELPADMPVTVIGLGSNLLVRDGGIRGAVICTSGLPKAALCIGDEAGGTAHAGGALIRASAGLPCATFAKRCASLGVGPAAFFAGIPGTIGGALAMNAGAFGGETWDRVRSVETIDRRGTVRARAKSEFTIGYRSVRGAAGEWFLTAVFAMASAEPTDAAEIRALLRQRGEKQPLGTPSAGSVFRNPEGAHAGALIERAGLKGARVGGAVVADKHANFIINEGTATAADVEALIAMIRARVLEATGVVLEPEVRIIGEERAPR